MAITNKSWHVRYNRVQLYFSWMTFFENDQKRMDDDMTKDVTETVAIFTTFVPKKSCWRHKSISIFYSQKVSERTKIRRFEYTICTYTNLRDKNVFKVIFSCHTSYIMLEGFLKTRKHSIFCCSSSSLQNDD